MAQSLVVSGLVAKHRELAGLIEHHMVGKDLAKLLLVLEQRLERPDRQLGESVVSGIALLTSHLLGGVLFGLATSLLPWFILLPSFGRGLFGRRGPRGSNALLADMVSHVAYGLGVGAVIAAGSNL